MTTDTTTTATTTVVVIDDDPVSRAVVRVVLERAGHGVIDAGDVASGLAAVDDLESISVVVCDYLLPDGTGLDVLEARPWLHDRFILMTGTTERDELGDDRVSLIQVYLTKPVGTDALVEAVEAVAGQRHCSDASLF